MPLAAPDISEGDRERVWAALEDPRIAGGPSVVAFEQAVSSQLEAGQGVAVTSGTAALHLALIAVGVEPGDLVLMPTQTFVAPAHAASYVGAELLLFDSEARYRQLDVERMVAWLREHCDSDGEKTIHVESGKRIGAIVPVDLLGHLCDVEALAAAVRDMGIPLVEDAAQGLGATLRGRPAGAHADVTCLSFNANKLVTSGGGGMLLCRNEKLIRYVRDLANQAKIDGPYYVHKSIGFNYRLPSAQAALGLAQFERIDEFLERKARVARFYERELSSVAGLSLPQRAPEATVTNWLFTVHVDPSVCGCTADELMKRLEKGHRIESRPIFTPLHSCGVYAGRQAHDCPVAERLAASGLSIPSSVSASDDELARVCEAIRIELGSS
ncbi:MAG TPA: aminotransferase class I/II-fold pyridoxal phosphate-dependent enzyme [Solirubrobacterales bacterium]|nr:aminotransferase class I/II-fold pyridoxal phosphate-dependent enzyme [Solirubrobacterales bacterium]